MAEDRQFDAARPLEIADQGVFSVPGRYLEVAGETVMVGQIFVHWNIGFLRHAWSHPVNQRHETASQEIKRRRQRIVRPAFQRERADS